ncbi:MAG: tRNA epoxyqueuosine(34) reductase QueG [Actinobacteria bacterium]|nr:tRNA epoxyqueuosine(34) reductase QueG [Actinomycetota bacterium]
MRPADRQPRSGPVSAEYSASIVDMARDLGIDRLGFTDASVLHRARVALDDRVARGLSDTMGFTFRNPERSTDPTRAVEGARSVIVAARSYNVVDEQRPVGPVATVARYARIDQYTPLRQALQKIALRLRADGFRAVVFADENDLVDREVAHRAGLGWFGKNANILLPGMGSFFSLGSIVTTAEFPPAPQPAPDGCGSCRTCIDDCPTGAIVDNGVIDARRCLAWLVQKPGVFPAEFRVALGDRIYGCDDCQTTCPPNVRLSSRHRPRDSASIPVPVGPGQFVDLLELLWANDARIIELYGRWYLADRDPMWLRRNALVILGNVASVPVDESVREVLRHYLGSDVAILRAHAVWAARRLGQSDLAETVRNDLDELVRAEWNAPVTSR